MVVLAAWSHDTRDCGDEHAEADFAMVGRGVGAEMCCSKMSKTFGAIPCQSGEIVAHGMKRCVLGYRLDSGSCDGDADTNALTLQPVRRQRVVAVGPQLW